MEKNDIFHLIYTIVMYYKLKDYARKFNVCYRTAWNRFNKGLIDGAFKDNLGNILIPIEELDSNKYTKAALYARVSNNSAKENLDRQMERIIDFSMKNGFKIQYQIKEISSGMNDGRIKLCHLLAKDDWDVIIVENKDRLTRFGFNYIELLLKTRGKEILVINQTNKDTKEDLISDLVSIVYSFTARIYGLRKGRLKGSEIKNIIKDVSH
jgi:predicted site-specific integrase-resolvase